MEYVNLIKDIVVEQVPYIGQSEIGVRHHIGFNNSGCCEKGYEGIFLTQARSEYRIVEVKSWVQTKLRDKSYFKDPIALEIEPREKNFIIEKDFIALSPFVDNVLGKYIKVLDTEIVNLKYKVAEEYMKNGSLSEKISDLKHRREVLNKSFWERLKYLFKGDSYEFI